MRIVLARLSALGDIVHTWPLAEAIREIDPKAHLTWTVEERLLPLVEGHPAVDTVITVRSRDWRRRPWSARTRMETAALRTRLHELQPDLVLDPQGVLKSAVLTRWTGAPRRVGLARPWRRELLAGLAYTETLPGAAAGCHVVATNLEFVRALGAEPPRIRPPAGSWLYHRVLEHAPFGPWQDHSYAVLLPGVGGAHKILPTQTLGAVAGSLDLATVVVWGPGERQRAAEVVEAGGGRVHLAPPTDLEELTAILGGAAIVIGGDTGPLHLAASLGVPTLGVFLASDPRRNGPIGKHTAVLSGAEEHTSGPRGSARARPRRVPTAEEIISAARNLLDE
jgi:lipopolysaccharide heptosyltransferase I